MRVLFTHGHTLYAKVTIPLALRLREEGHEVVFERRRDRWHRFSDRYVRAHPQNVAVVDRASLRYAARLIGYEREWEAAEGSIELGRPRGRFDVVVGVTKELERLRALASAGDARVFALGYQHMPYVVAVGREQRHDGSPFLQHNAFTDAHRFLEILGGDLAVPNSFLFLDRVVERRPARSPAGDRVLIFHPGGWRNVVTAPGEGARASREKQLAFFERACRPLLEAGLRPVIKVHPLRARHHDTGDVRAVADAIDPSIEVLAPDAWFWDDAFASAFVVNYGSSSIYELWSAGIRSAVVCNFEGSARSGKFAFFDSVFIDSHDEYRAFVAEERWRTLELDPLAREVSDAYAELCDGRATERAARIVTEGS
jgi:hypothetical protein